MAGMLDQAWAETVCSVCDPVCQSAHVGFTRQLLKNQSGGIAALLWEANPLLFAERFPGSRIVASYASDWPPPCIDYWVHVDAESHQATFDVEGLGPDDDVVQLSGDGLQDGRAIGQVLARMLGVPAPH